jgi:4-aminobutyrate aminotransferase-like enzyme/Ser/Thr protein kinase RdoA (MazF antagonist)
LEAPRPAFSADQASHLAKSLFDFDGDARELSGERDQIFAIHNGAGTRILKISNRNETQAGLEFELAILRHIAAVDPSLPVPRQIPLPERTEAQTADEYIGRARHGESEHFVRMLTHLDGQVRIVGSGLTDHALRSFGRTAARLGLALRGFFHPAAGRTLLWDPRQIVGMRPLLERIADGDRRALLERTIGRFEILAVPRWPSLRAQVVHADLNLDNVLFDDEDTVCGIIDFGDALHGPLLLDVASAGVASMSGREGSQLLRAVRLFLDGYEAINPLEPAERELAGSVIAARLATTLTVGTWFVHRHPDNADRYESLLDDSWKALELLDKAGPDQVDRALGTQPLRQPTAVLREKRLRLLGPTFARLFYDDPVHVVAGEGTWLIDADGRRLLDCYNNVAVVGHCHPRVTEAVVDQTRRLNTHTRYLYEPLMDLGERLTGSLAQHDLDSVMIVNSGSEANEIAWRMATSYTGQEGAIVSDWAYHGMTAALADFGPNQWPDGYRPHHVETFRVEAEGATPSVSSADEIEQAIRRLRDRGLKPAALFIEGGFTNEGVLRPATADMIEAVRIARDAGALIVADEVQIGHGRTGAHLWGFDGYGYVPDFVTMGKPMGNGYPVAAMVTRSDIVARFSSKQYFSTFGGNPVAARAALTVLEVIEDEGLLAHVESVGHSMAGRFSELRRKRPLISDVRHHGMLFGLQITATPSTPAPRGAELVVNGLRARGVLVGRTGRNDDVLKIRPPLVFSDSEAAVLVAALDDTLGELQ